MVQCFDKKNLKNGKIHRLEQKYSRTLKMDFFANFFIREFINKGSVPKPFSPLTLKFHFFRWEKNQMLKVKRKVWVSN